MRGIASIPRRLANAFVAFFGQHGDISREARKTGQSRQSMYRDAQEVVEQVNDARTEAEIERLRQELIKEQERSQELAARLEQWREPSEELAAWLVLLSFGIAAEEDPAAQPPKLNWNPGPEYADSVRMFQGIPSIERAHNGRLWATWYGGGTAEGAERIRGWIADARK
jgi:hypothetical protein